MIPILTSQSCVNPCTNIQTVPLPGQKGDSGEDGLNGVNGHNAHTILAAGFTMPAIGAATTIEVASSLWVTPGQVLFIEDAGYMRVVSVPDSSFVEVENIGTGVNAAGGTPILAGGGVSPGGEVGPSGLGGAIRGTFALPNGVNTHTIAGLAFGFLPTSVQLTVRSPVGGLVLVAVIQIGSLSNDGFTLWLNGLTDSADYLVDYLATP